MIYTVTFNPSLDYTVSVDDFRPGFTNRTESEQLIPGGKGINVSVVLMNLGVVNTALGFVAGFTGNEIVKRLEDIGINNGFICLKNGFSRINIKLKSPEGTEINGHGPVIDNESINKMTDRLDGLKEGDVLFLSGSIPYGVTDDIYRNIMKQIRGKKVMTVVDATKDLLMNTLSYEPFLIKPNNHELEEIFGVELNTRESVVPYGMQLRKMGAKNVLISMAGEGAVLVTEDGNIYEADAPEGRFVNGVGAGDSMVAGYMAGYMEKQDHEYAFRMGIAAGSASAFSENLATKQEIEDVFKRVKVKKRRRYCNENYRLN